MAQGFSLLEKELAGKPGEQSPVVGSWSWSCPHGLAWGRCGYTWLCMWINVHGRVPVHKAAPVFFPSERAYKGRCPFAIKHVEPRSGSLPPFPIKGTRPLAMWPSRRRGQGITGAGDDAGLEPRVGPEPGKRPPNENERAKHTRRSLSEQQVGEPPLARAGTTSAAE